MKRFLFLMTVVTTGIGAVFADEQLISFEQLPQQAQTFTRKYFPADHPMYRSAYAMYDPELFDSSYMVVFTNGDGIEFNKEGEWKDFDCKECVVPTEIIPEAIRTYLSQQGFTQPVKKIEKNRRSYELELDNGIELEFDLEGNLLKVDD